MSETTNCTAVWTIGHNL